jgi:F0F1-type ATP synthase assembly protein I
MARNFASIIAGLCGRPNILVCPTSEGEATPTVRPSMTASGFLLPAGFALSTSSDADIRPLAARILFTQVGMGGAVALACWIIWGARAGRSALIGAAIGVVANLYMTMTALKPALTARGALVRLYIAQAVKVALTVALFFAAWRFARVSWPALLAAYAATLAVFWWVPFAASKRD